MLHDINQILPAAVADAPASVFTSGEVGGDAVIVAPPRPKTDAEIVAVGYALLAAKASMRGTFKQWVESSCPFTYRSAANYMAAARDVSSQSAGEIAAANEEHAQVGRELYLNLKPTRTGKPSANEATIARVARFLLPDEHHLDIGNGCPDIMDAVGVATRHLPSLTYGELLDAARDANFTVMMAKLNLELIMSLAQRMPPDGIVASCKLADQCKSTEGENE